ncbi:unnamed protein product [Calypogeia fissa]
MRCGCEREKVLHNATIYTTSTSNSTTTGERDQNVQTTQRPPGKEMERHERDDCRAAEERKRVLRPDPRAPPPYRLPLVDSLLLHYYDSVRLLAESSGEASHSP